QAGQPVVGSVVDGTTAQPIAGATVRVVGANVVATTDKYGHFQIPEVPEGTWTVEVAKPPFESTTDTFTVGATPPEPLQLLLIGEVAAINLVEKSNMVELAPREKPAPGGTQVVREEIVHVPGARGDVLTAVQSLPGMANVGTMTQFAGGLIIRGSAPA